MQCDIHRVTYQGFCSQIFNLNLIKPSDLSSSLQKLQELEKEDERQPQEKLIVTGGIL